MLSVFSLFFFLQFVWILDTKFRTFECIYIGHVQTTHTLTLFSRWRPNKWPNWFSMDKSSQIVDIYYISNHCTVCSQYQPRERITFHMSAFVLHKYLFRSFRDKHNQFGLLSILIGISFVCLFVYSFVLFICIVLSHTHTHTHVQC